MGRPKKVGAKKPGELNKGLTRFVFIAKSAQIRRVKQLAVEQGITIKTLMETIIEKYLKDETKKRKPSKNNLAKLKNYFSGLGQDKEDGLSGL